MQIIIHKAYFDPFIDLSGDIAIIVLERAAIGFEQIGLPNAIGKSIDVVFKQNLIFSIDLSTCESISQPTDSILHCVGID